MLHEYQSKESAPITHTPELDLALSDSELLDLIQRKLDEYTALLKDKKIEDRSQRLVKYWKGTQETDRKAGMPEKRYSNNIIHRDLATRIQNATSRMPDIVVMSPQQDEDPSVKEQSRKVEDWLGIRFDNDVTRRLAQSGLRDNHLKFRGIWKYRYDKFKKDAVIDRLRPEDVVLDATARIPEDGYTADNMEFIGEWMEEATASVLAKFPDKAKQLTDEISREAKAKNKPTSSKIRYLESWAKVHKKSGEPTIIVIHSYNRILLDKGICPYFDEREGSETEFGVIPDEKLHPEIAAVLPSLGLDVPENKPKRFNHFAYPRMPYSIFSGENIGDGPFDDTTVVEVSIPMQDTVNLRGDQISQINDWAIPKTVVSTEAMTNEKASNITRDASEIITVKVPQGQSIESVITTFTGEPASLALYQDLQQAVSAIDAHFSTNPVTRGETVTQESGISKQISREGDLSAADDIAQTMVQRCVEEACNWMVQLAKIYFDKPIAATAPGPGKSLRSSAISRDMIPDDIQIVVKANAVDKMTLRNMSMNLVGEKGIDPYNLFLDLDYPNPKERAQDLVDFLEGGADGYVKYLADIGVDPAQPANQQDESSTTPVTPPTQPAPPGQPQPGMGQPPAPPMPAAPPQVPPSLPSPPTQPLT